MSDFSKDAIAAAIASPGAAQTRESWFGTWIGQTTAAVMLLVGYVSAVMLTYRLWRGELEQLHADHPIAFFALFAGPLVVIFVFSVLPAFLRTLRERRLVQLADNAEPVKPGYFRLAPYGERDRGAYHRPDEAVNRAFDWIARADSSILYLSGASGSGKSSLINAGLVPRLRESGWKILMVRGMGEPLTGLTQALRSDAQLYASAPPKKADALALLKLADDEIRRVDGGPLRVVLDQFEEYLSLDGGEEKPAYAAFLSRLAAAPLKNVHLLHVLREDYRALVFKLGLPRYIPGETGFELAAFTRTEAQGFLDSGPRVLGPDGYARLFHGLDQIEATRGLYRPITLNMIGYVLVREGAELTVDPGRLIETCLKRSITSGPSRDFARPVLEAMITEAGTKQPVDAGELSERTNIPAHQVQATLVDLQQAGLVRPLSGERWEISHDFLATLIGRITGRLRPPLLRRFALPALSLTAVVWVAALVVVVPMWMKSRALEDILALGLSRQTGLT